MRFQHKSRTPRLQAFCQGMPVFPAQHHAKVWDRHIMTIYRIRVGGFLRGRFRVFVDHQLVAEEVEVDPMLAGTPLFQAEEVAPLWALRLSESSLVFCDEKTIVFVPSSNYFDQSRRRCCEN